MQGLIVDALTSKRIPTANKVISFQRAVADYAAGATHANPNRHASLASDPAAKAVTSRGAVSHVDGSKPPKTTRVYTGMMTITGTFSDTNGDKGTWSGSMSDALYMTVDRGGTGSGYEAFSGVITLSVTHSDGSKASSSNPLVFSTPDFNLRDGKFKFSQNNGLDFGGLNLTLNLSGSFSTGQSAVSEKLGLPFNGFVNGVLVSGALKGASTLTTKPLSISGVAASLSSAGSNVTPFGNLDITDLNNATVTATVTLSKTGTGKLTNLAGGTYNRTKGTYTITGSEAVINSALEGLTFDPTIPSASQRHATTGFKLSVTDSQGASLPSSTTQLVVTNPLYITGISAHHSTTGTKAVSPFRNVTVSDFSEGASHDEVLKVVLSDPKNGKLENLGGGVYSKTTGIYVIHGSPTTVTSALRGLQFDPTSSASAATTTFKISVTNAEGASISNSSTTVTDNPATPVSIGSGVFMFSQYVALGFHTVGDHAAAISALHDHALPAHLELVSSHR